jgi:hypothetical protein
VNYRGTGSFVCCAASVLWILAGCTHRVQDAKPSDATATQSVVDGPAIVGLDQFDQMVRPVTSACGAHDYALDYSPRAQERIIAAATQRLGASVKMARISISAVEIQMRCFSVHCSTDATVSLQATWTAGPRTRSADTREQGTGKASAGLFCAEGGKSVAQAVDSALERALAAALAAAP